jgi:hypothetical protein
MPLRHGDRITIGTTVFRFDDEAASQVRRGRHTTPALSTCIQQRGLRRVMCDAQKLQSSITVQRQEAAAEGDKENACAAATAAASGECRAAAPTSPAGATASGPVFVDTPVLDTDNRVAIPGTGVALSLWQHGGTGVRPATAVVEPSAVLFHATPARLTFVDSPRSTRRSSTGTLSRHRSPGQARAARSPALPSSHTTLLSISRASVGSCVSGVSSMLSTPFAALCDRRVSGSGVSSGSGGGGGAMSDTPVMAGTAPSMGSLSRTASSDADDCDSDASTVLPPTPYCDFNGDSLAISSGGVSLSAMFSAHTPAAAHNSSTEDGGGERSANDTTALAGNEVEPTPTALPRISLSPFTLSEGARYSGADAASDADADCGIGKRLSFNDISRTLGTIDEGEETDDSNEA